MAYLLDTHALLWWLGDDERLPPRARELLGSPDEEVYVSAASGWEIAIKKALGKLRAPDNLAAIIEDEGLQHLSIRFSHAERAGALPPIHRDPFDRMLVAQALAEGIPLISGDGRLADYAACGLVLVQSR